MSPTHAMNFRKQSIIVWIFKKLYIRRQILTVLPNDKNKFQMQYLTAKMKSYSVFLWQNLMPYIIILLQKHVTNRIVLLQSM